VSFWLSFTANWNPAGTAAAPLMERRSAGMRWKVWLISTVGCCVA
jgi:hypothetical protein